MLHPPNFAEKTFTNSHKTAKFAKVFSLESFLLSVYSTVLVTSYCMLMEWWDRRKLPQSAVHKAAVELSYKMALLAIDGSIHALAAQIAPLLT